MFDIQGDLTSPKIRSLRLAVADNEPTFEIVTDFLVFAMSGYGLRLPLVLNYCPRILSIREDGPCVPTV